MDSGLGDLSQCESHGEVVEVEEVRVDQRRRVIVLFKQKTAYEI